MWPLNSQRGLYMTVKEYKGVTKVHIRKYLKSDTGTYIPTRKGITLDSHEWNILKNYADDVDARLSIQVTPTDMPHYSPVF